MQDPILTSCDGMTANGGAEDFYVRVLKTLHAAGVPFLIGGAYAFNCFTGISRHTKDLDIFIRQADYGQLSDALSAIGYQAELTYSHWLGKVHDHAEFVDVIFSSGNGIAEVDDGWFEHAPEAEIFGIPVKICPIEETIWSKAFIMERERFDGADIAHLLLACSNRIDWHRLLDRFATHWRILLVHLIMFGFVYASQRDLIPAWVMEELLGRLKQEIDAPPPEEKICGGSLLSREQYLMDIQQWGYRDARLVPTGNMTSKETANWTNAIADKNK